MKTEMNPNHILDMLREGKCEELRAEAWAAYKEECGEYLKKTKPRVHTDAAVRRLAETHIPNKTVARIWQDLKHTYVFCMHSVVSLNYALKQPCDTNKVVFDFVYDMFARIKKEDEITDAIDWEEVLAKARTNWKNKHERVALWQKDGTVFRWDQKELAVPTFEMEQILTIMNGEFRVWVEDRGVKVNGISYPWLYLESEDVQAIVLTAMRKDEF